MVPRVKTLSAAPVDPRKSPNTTPSCPRHLDDLGCRPKAPEPGRRLTTNEEARRTTTIMKLVIAATGASGAIYLQRLLLRLDPSQHEVHVVLSAYARQVISEELGELHVKPGIHQHGDKTMNVPFVSGSTRFDAMVIIPCSMGTMGRIATGASDSTILRAADVFLKERRRLIVVPREMPWNLIHARNVVTLLEAGTTVIPACPGFYGRAATIEDLVDTVVERVLDQIGLPVTDAFRWKEDGE